MEVANWFTASDVILNVHYFDSGTGAIALNYDLYDETVQQTPPIPNGAGKYIPEAFTATGSSQWKIASVHLQDARFSGEANGRDFRFEFGNVVGDLPIRAVWITAVTTNACSIARRLSWSIRAVR